MSDAAFKTAKYPAYTTAELQAAVINARAGNCFDPERAVAAIPDMEAEIARRILVKAGVTSVMTDGERLRHARAE